MADAHKHPATEETAEPKAVDGDNNDRDSTNDQEAKPIASFSMSHALNFLRSKKEEQKRSKEAEEKAKEEERLEKARMKEKQLKDKAKERRRKSKLKQKAARAKAEFAKLAGR